jgi:hypothetical protein
MMRVSDFDPNTPSIARVYDYFVAAKTISPPTGTWGIG